MDDLIAFVAARLDEDEAVAKAAASPSLHDLSWTAVDHPPSWAIVVDSASDLVVKAEPERSTDSFVAAHVARHDPARVLRKVAADRRLLDACRRAQEAQPGDSWESDYTQALEDAVRYRATVWSDHPDYRPDWAL